MLYAVLGQMEHGLLILNFMSNRAGVFDLYFAKTLCVRRRRSVTN